MLSLQRHRTQALACMAILLLLVRAGHAEPGDERATLAEINAPSPAAAELAELDGWLARLTGDDAHERQAAVLAMGTASSRLLPAIDRRLQEFAGSANHEGVQSALKAVRPRSGSLTASHARAAPRERADTLGLLMASPRPRDAGWRQAVIALGLVRMLAQVGTLPAVSELVAMVPAWDPLRRDIEEQLKRLGDKAVAALIETRRGEVRNLRPWAARLLDSMGKTVPGEAVQTSDNQVLADVLRAYGRTKDSDAARVIVSFANSDRAVVRDAARESVTMLGDAGLWQLRESYESSLGKKPPDSWGWQRVKDELFAADDRARLMGAEALMEQGLVAQRAGDWPAMARAFDSALARAPGFARAREMVPGYVAYARSLPMSERGRAILALRRATMLDPSGPHAAQALSLAVSWEADALGERGVVDRGAYARAVQLDPKNLDAERALTRVDALAVPHGGRGAARFTVAGLLVLLAAVGAAWVISSRRSWQRTTATENT